MVRILVVFGVLAQICIYKAGALQETMVVDNVVVDKTEYWNTVCEYSSNPGAATCSQGSVIRVVQAFFGAWEASTSTWCGYPPEAIRSCIIDVSSRIADLCNQRQSCVIPTNLDLVPGKTSMATMIGSDPCIGYRKYLLFT